MTAAVDALAAVALYPAWLTWVLTCAATCAALALADTARNHTRT